jgi:hypothetical protein
MSANPSDEKWQVRIYRPGIPGLDRIPDLVGLPDLKKLPFLGRALLPAEAGEGLREAMLARDNQMEDVNYTRVVPNRFVVEVAPNNFAQHYGPIAGQVIKQWSDRLLEALMTANSRQGRRAFRFGGRLRIEIRPAANLQENEARILSRIEPDLPPPQVSTPPGARPRPQAPLTSTGSRPRMGQQPLPPRQSGTVNPQRNMPASSPATIPGAPPRGERPGGAGARGGRAVSAYLELVPTGQRWALYPGVNTIGRSETCQIYLNIPVVQERRLVSGQHAYVVMENGVCTLYDGSPDGRPSSNGTYVNLRRISPQGYRLQNGDAIVLAAVDPLFPRSDTPGTVTFYFWMSAGA